MDDRIYRMGRGYPDVYVARGEGIAPVPVSHSSYFSITISGRKFGHFNGLLDEKGETPAEEAEVAKVRSQYPDMSRFEGECVHASPGSRTTMSF